MSRIVSVWLPRWPIQRILAAQAKQPSGTPVDPDRPFVLTLTTAAGPRIAALNAAAEAAGLVLGEPSADARAKADGLQAREIDTAADEAALRRLTLWATRYTPTVSPWDLANGADGFFLDIEGAAHLFGGEEKLLADLSNRLKNFGLPARLAVADTPGAAWALARFYHPPCTILRSGEEAAALASLPIEGLRLSPETCAALRRLGFKTVGGLLDKPRAPFAARFPAELLRRLDQALGRTEEPLVPIVAPPVYHSLRYLLEPIITQEAVIALARRLMHTFVHVLTRDDVGARALRLSLYNVDGAVETIDIGLTLPTRDVAHVVRLLDLKLDALTAMRDAGFGYEAVGLAVTRAERIPARQMKLNVDRHPEVRAQRASKDDGPGASTASFEGHLRWPPQNDDNTERCAVLIDTLRQRLGPYSVRRFEPVASHLPERAEVLLSVNGEEIQPPPARGGKVRVGEAPASWAWPEPDKPRPLLILPRAEPTEVTALVPDGPPRRFCWRGVIFEVASSEGPERIASEWWRSAIGHRSSKPTRDYYRVEDTDGRRFWLYREGLYGRETMAARWFVQGLFG